MSESTPIPQKPRAPMRGLKGQKKRRRVTIVVLAFAALIAATLFVGIAMKDGINFFRSPSQTLEEAPSPEETFRLGGLVKEGSIQNTEGMQFDFIVTDGANDIPVRYIGNEPRPDLFKENTGTIATGKLINGRFEATKLLARHDETYMPKEVMDALKEQGVYKENVAP